MGNPKPRLGRDWLEVVASATDYLGRRPGIFLSVITVLALVPFASKAFHIDDPLFLWAARHIQTDPLNYYNFDVNWYGMNMPASDVIKNPPTTSYYIALVTSIIGWKESRLHLAFLIFAVAVILGSYVLAKRYCTRPVLAALAILFTPAFLVSSTNIMCDTMMLALWVWALVFWEEGIRDNSVKFVILAGLLAGMCALTKYFGVCLIPLMLVDGVVRKRRLGSWLIGVLVPLFVLGIYEWHTRRLYGHGLFLDAARYAAPFNKANLGGLTIVALSFLGGCIFSLAFYSHLIWDRWKIIAGFGAIGVVALLLNTIRPIFLTKHISPDGVFSAAVQMSVFAIFALGVLLLALTDLWRQRDADSVMLCLWVCGTFVFAGFLNWTTNARSILPLVPAVVILLFRRLDLRIGKAARILESRLLWPLLPAAVVTFLITSADCWLANSARSAAYILHDKTKAELGTLWFEGHWGFQYYMEALGAKPLNIFDTILQNGDVLAVPSNTPNLTSFPERFPLIRVFQTSPPSFISTMNHAVGAGFYASDWGPLPIVVGGARPERYELFLIPKGIRLSGPHEKSGTVAPR
jgi:4-amino-4-deoxy-L-arabinose transferase-like glycosyltransferase